MNYRPVQSTLEGNAKTKRCCMIEGVCVDMSTRKCGGMVAGGQNPSSPQFLHNTTGKTPPYIKFEFIYMSKHKQPKLKMNLFPETTDDRGTSLEFILPQVSETRSRRNNSMTPKPCPTNPGQFQAVAHFSTKLQQSDAALHI